LDTPFASVVGTDVDVLQSGSIPSEDKLGMLRQKANELDAPIEDYKIKIKAVYTSSEYVQFFILKSLPWTLYADTCKPTQIMGLTFTTLRSLAVTADS